MASSRTFRSLVAVALVAVAGFLGYQQWAMSRLHGMLEDDLSALLAVYRQSAEDNVFPAEYQAKLTPRQKDMVTGIRDTLQAAATAGSVRDGALLLQRVQVSLIDYANAFPDVSLPGDPVSALRTDLSEHGAPRPLLDGYNQHATLWNHKRSSYFGGLSASTLSEPADVLPFLSFDGQSAYVNVVQL